MQAEQKAIKEYKGSIVVVEDEENMCKILTKILNLDGYHVTTFINPIKALDYIKSYAPDIVITDIKMPELSGMDVLKRVKEANQNTGVIVITAYATIEGAIEAMKAGAFHYVTKPFKTDELLMTLQKAMEHKRLLDENVIFSEHVRREFAGINIIGDSPAMQTIKALIAKIAPTESAVLIRGASGTGKELVAKAIHNASHRRLKRFVPINCPTIPETLIESELFGHEKGAFTGATQTKHGLIELAHEGTLFLDEIGDLPLHLQAKLLRVLQEREIQRVGGLKQIPVDIRLLAATNHDLEKAIEQGTFRSDLFYRLNVINIVLPPLREREDDIEPLVEYFLNRFSQQMRKPKMRITPDAMSVLKEYHWPGNVRELENVLERLCVLAEKQTIEVEDIPADLQQLIRELPSATPPRVREIMPSIEYRSARQQFESYYMTELLRRTEGNITEAARISGMSRRNLYEKVEKLGIDLEQFKKNTR
jgi:two-component system NtrC family response regulator